MTFLEKLQQQNAAGRYACAGLDPVEEQMGQAPWRTTLYSLAQAARNDAAAYKPNWAFYLERIEEGGLFLLRDLCRVIRSSAPEAVIVLDMKCGDIGKTNMGYVRWAFGMCGVDAITVHSYMGSEAMAPFLSDPNRGVFVLCKTSNPGAAEMQDVPMADGHPYFHHVARTVSAKWNTNGNCGLVIGATYPAELEQVRELVPELPLLVPGIGAQGGDLLQTVMAATKRRPHAPFVVNQSSSFMYQPTLDGSVEQLRILNTAVHAGVMRS